MITYPNQKIIHINKETSNDFLQIDKDAWMKASNELTYNAFKIYLYLAGNQDGFDLALSRKALTDNIKMHDNSYSKGIKELTDKGYIIHKQGNIYDFYLIPHSSGISHSSVDIYHTTVGDTTTLQCGDISHSSVGEIDKIYKRDIFYISDSDNKLSSSDASHPERKKELEELSDEELNDLKKDYKQGKDVYSYPELQNKYNLVYGVLNKELLKNIDTIIENRNKAKKDAELGEYILLQDGSLSDWYRVGSFDIPKEDLHDKFIELTDYLGYYKFDKNFVTKWFKEKYGYVHEDEYIPDNDWDGTYLNI